jgi:sec-independent protein translocase protein TatA
MIGGTELIIVLLVIALIFGASRFPKIAKSIGEGLKELKKGIRESRDGDVQKIE